MCPIYIAYGMTYEQYWYGRPDMVKAYRDAFMLKRRMQNEDMWLQGMYMHRALESVIGTAFGKRRINYEQKPFDVFPKTKLEKEQELVEKRKKLINYLNNLKK